PHWAIAAARRVLFTWSTHSPGKTYRRLRNEDDPHVHHVGAGEPAADESAKLVEKRVSIVAAEGLFQIEVLLPGGIPHLDIGDGASRVGGAVLAVRPAAQNGQAVQSAPAEVGHRRQNELLI